MNAPLVKPNPSRSAGSTAVLEYLARIWPLSACRAALSSVFVQADANKTATSPLVKRIDAALANLVDSGMLNSQGKGADRKWSLGPAAKLTGSPGAHQQPEPTRAAYVGQPAPARQLGVMHASVYQSRPMQALRPGSDDFTRLPSLRQNGQRLPFTGGYIAVAGSKS